MTPPPGAPVEIVAVGYELLCGHTVDTNSAWLARRLPGLGGRVTRIVAVDDDPPAIAAELRGARARGAVLAVTTGGLGPTFDDRTLAGVAAAFGRRLTEHPEALAAVARRYAVLAAEGSVDDGGLTPERRKMALLPEGAEMVENAVGTAPGALVVREPFATLALPGVPREMQAVFDAAAPRLAPRLGLPVFLAEREVASGCGDESRLTAIAERVMAVHPSVHLKSLATSFAPDCDLAVRLSATGKTQAEAEGRLAAAADLFLQAMKTLKE